MIKRLVWELSVLCAALALPVAELHAQDSITVTSPVAGDVWEVGSTQHITWETNLTDVTIRYSTDDGATWSVIADTVDDTSADWLDLPWEVPDEPSEQCKIHIEGYYGEAPTDSGTFEIAVPTSGDGDGDGDEAAGGLCAGLHPGEGLAALVLLAGLALHRRRRS